MSRAEFRDSSAEHNRHQYLQVVLVSPSITLLRLLWSLVSAMRFDHWDRHVPVVDVSAQRASLCIGPRHSTTLLRPSLASFPLLESQFLLRCLELDLRFRSGFKVR